MKRKLSVVRAVITDLYGTIMYAEDDMEHLYRETAKLLEIEVERIARAREAIIHESMLGTIASPQEHARRMLRELGIEPDLELISQLVEVERTARMKGLHLYPTSIPTLQRLRTNGFALGLLSNASYFGHWFVETFQLEQYYDATIISCDVGLIKPDPRIYRLMCERLAIEPHECLYVGDGADNELQGAADVGMQVALLHQPHGFSMNSSVEGYQYVISSLAEVEDLLPQQERGISDRPKAGA